MITSVLFIHLQSPLLSIQKSSLYRAGRSFKKLPKEKKNRITNSPDGGGITGSGWSPFAVKLTWLNSLIFHGSGDKKGT